MSWFRTVMLSIESSGIPEHAFLKRYGDGGGYADCYVTHIESSVSQSQYVEAFYTTGLFKLERLILAMFASRPSTDRDALALAEGSTLRFAAWDVENRDESQLLLCDFTGRTRSWLAALPSQHGGTRLYFGSAVVARNGSVGTPALGYPFRALLGFHKLYSIALLYAARSRLRARTSR